jgi:hypothetical protein
MVSQIHKCYSAMAPLRCNPTAYAHPRPHILLSQLPALMRPLRELQRLVCKIQPRALRHRCILHRAHHRQSIRGLGAQTRRGVDRSLPSGPRRELAAGLLAQRNGERRPQEREGVRARGPEAHRHGHGSAQALRRHRHDSSRFRV